MDPEPNQDRRHYHLGNYRGYYVIKNLSSHEDVARIVLCISHMYYTENEKLFFK